MEEPVERVVVVAMLYFDASWKPAPPLRERRRAALCQTDRGDDLEGRQPSGGVATSCIFPGAACFSGLPPLRL